MKRRFKAFVASTYDDLKAHREHVIKQLRRSGIDVDPMEDWAAESDEPKRFSKERLEGCLICVLLVARRRGYVPRGEKESITQMEYEHARAQGLEILAFLLDDKADWQRHYDELDKDPGLRQWREKLMERHGVSLFGTKPESVDIGPAIVRCVLKLQPRDEPPPDPDCLSQKRHSSQLLGILGRSGATKCEEFFTVRMPLRDWQNFLEEVNEKRGALPRSEWVKLAPESSRAAASFLLEDYLVASKVCDQNLEVNLTFEHLRLTLLAHLARARTAPNSAESVAKAAMCLACLKRSPDLWRFYPQQGAASSLQASLEMVDSILQDLLQKHISPPKDLTAGLSLANFARAEDESARAVQAAGGKQVLSTEGMLRVAFGYMFAGVYGKRLELRDPSGLSSDQVERHFSDLFGHWYLARHGEGLQVLQTAPLLLSSSRDPLLSAAARLVRFCALDWLNRSLSVAQLTTMETVPNCLLALRRLAEVRQHAPLAEKDYSTLQEILAGLVTAAESSCLTSWQIQQIDSILNAAKPLFGTNASDWHDRMAIVGLRAKTREALGKGDYPLALQTLSDWSHLGSPTAEALAWRVEACLGQFRHGHSAAGEAASQALAALRTQFPAYPDLSGLEKLLSEAKAEEVPAPEIVITIDEAAQRLTDPKDTNQKTELLIWARRYVTRQIQVEGLSAAQGLFQQLRTRFPEIHELNEVFMSFVKEWEPKLSTDEFTALFQAATTPFLTNHTMEAQPDGTTVPTTTSELMPMAEEASQGELDRLVIICRLDPSSTNRVRLLDVAQQAVGSLFARGEARIAANLLGHLKGQLPGIGELQELPCQLLRQWQRRLSPDQVSEFEEALLSAYPRELPVVHVQAPEENRSANHLAAQQRMREEESILQRLVNYKNNEKRK
ncbi:MAG: DUF4062 domain-containing protein [Terriglobales bacterium]|jgi:uncharacterized protein DUF4062